jgi:hypothetical protein
MFKAIQKTDMKIRENIFYKTSEYYVLSALMQHYLAVQLVGLVLAFKFPLALTLAFV